MLLGLLGLLGADIAWRYTATIDEFADIPLGLAGWRSRDFSMDARNPPLLKLIVSAPAHVAGAVVPGPGWRRPEVGWWPWLHGTRFMRDNAARYDWLVFLGRLPVLTLNVVLALVLWRCSRERHGEVGGLLSLALFALSPTVIAHGSLATTDLGATLFFFSAAAAADRHLQTRRLAPLYACALLSGAALASKFSTVVLYPGLAIAFLLAVPGTLVERGRFALARVALLGLTAILVLQVVYMFPGGTRMAELEPGPRSGPLRLLAKATGSMALPLPPDFLRGFDDALAYARDPELPGYLDGEWSKDGFRRYHLEAFLLKEPLSLIAILGLSLAAGKLTVGRRSSLALILPAVLLALSLVGWNRVQYGLRYALPLYPFLFLWAGRAAALSRRRGGRWLLFALGLYQLASVLRSHPHELSYFNPIGGGPSRGFRHLADSNLDWGQDLGALAARLREAYPGRVVKLAYFGHVDPEHYGIPHEVLRGKEDARGLVAVSASYLAGEPYAITWRGVVPEPVPAGIHSWLADHQPIDHVGYSIYLYELP